MASIDKRPDGRYRARWREVPGGPQRSRQFNRKIDAQRFLDQTCGDLVRGAYVDPAAGRVTFREYAEKWRACQVHRPTTAEQTEVYLRRHAFPMLGDRPIGDVRRAEIQMWVKDRSEELAPSTVETIYRWVSTIFKSAVADRLISATPCIGIKLPQQEEREVVPLEVEQVEALVDAMSPRYRPLIVFAAGMGFRQGECLGLTVDRVDFRRRLARVDRQLIAARGGVPQFGPPKSNAGYRTVPMPGVVADALVAHLARFGPGPEGLVFTNSVGSPVRRGALSEVWHRAARDARLPAWATFHDLRHFYASLLIARGHSVKAVQRRLGHKSAIETLDTYSHLWPDSEDETRDAVDCLLGSLRTPADSVSGERRDVCEP
jgi:integrase